MDAKQLKDLIIEPVLHAMGMHSDAAVNLLLMTVAHESRMGHYIAQVQGPALGIYQIEPVTARDVVLRYLQTRKDLDHRFQAAFQLVNSHIIDWENVDPGKLSLKLISDLRFQTAVARMKYWMDTEPLPHATDVIGLAKYYKRVYNTELGSADISDVIDAYVAHVDPEARENDKSLH